MLALSLPMKSRKRLAPDVFDTFAMHADRGHDVTDIDCSSAGHKMAALTVVFWGLSNILFFTNKTRKIGLKNKFKKKLLCFYSIPIVMACGVSLLHSLSLASLFISVTSSHLLSWLISLHTQEMNTSVVFLVCVLESVSEVC